MVPDKFDMVDMGGIDLILMQGEEVPGLYNRLVESITQCRYQCLYNWLFDGVIIPPAYVEMEVGLDDEVRINEGVVVTADDIIHIYTLEPILEPRLTITENGIYLPSEGYVGLESVDVNVPMPVINPISITENGTYSAPTGVDGYSPVIVSVSGDDPFSLENYIESSGTQWIDTGYIPTLNTRVEVVANVPDDNAVHCLFGARDVASGQADAKAVLIYAGDTGSFRNNFYPQFSGAQDTISNIMPPYFGKKVLYRLMRGQYLVKDEGWNARAGSVSTGSYVTTTRSIYLFALNNVNSVAALSSYKLYRIRFYETDTLMMELVPWVDENDVVCMKDTVSGNLKYNAGTGVFVYGTDQ